MNIEFLTELKHKKDTHKRWKQGQATWEEYKDIVHTCMNGVRKAKAQLELKLAREVKGDKKGFYKDIGSKRKAKESECSLLSGAGDLVTKEMEKAEVLNAFFASVFNGKACPQASQVPEPPSRVWGSEAVPTVEEERVKDCLTHLDMHKTM